MKRSDIEYLIVEIADKIYKENADKINALNDKKEIIEFMRYENEKLLTEALFALTKIMTS